MNYRFIRPNSGSTGIFANQSWEMMGTGDFSGNGRGDVLLRNRNTGKWNIFLMTGRATNNGETLITWTQEWLVP